jgi:hypothetical protein
MRDYLSLLLVVLAGVALICAPTYAKTATVIYKYDEADRLTVVKSGSTKRTYIYDPAGDFLKKTIADIPTISYQMGFTFLTNTITETIQTGDRISFIANADSPEQDLLYCRFDLVPNYGTENFDPNRNYQTLQGFSASSSCTHTFTSAGSYIIVVWVSFNHEFAPGPALPIIGSSVTVGGDNTVNFTRLERNPSSSIRSGSPLAFTAKAIIRSGGDVYYRFDLVRGYGSNEFDPVNNWEILQDFSTGDSCILTFGEPGNHVLVAWASFRRGFPESTPFPLIGGAITVE